MVLEGISLVGGGLVVSRGAQLLVTPFLNTYKRYILVGILASSGSLYLSTTPFFMLPVLASVANAPDRLKLGTCFSSGGGGGFWNGWFWWKCDQSHGNDFTAVGREYICRWYRGKQA